ncbi:MAG: DUF3106 domain-containing protein [Bryobacteraceae bacterium]
MVRRFIIGCALSLVLSAGSFAQRAPGRRAGVGGNAGAGKLRKEQRPNRTVVDRWNRMAPADRERALAKLPPERRKRIEQELQNFRNLTPDERRQLRSRYQSFNQLPPEKQNQARKVWGQFNRLPEERRDPVRQEFDHLRAMPASEREARMKSAEFQDKFSTGELKMLQDLSGLVSPVE